MKKMIMLLFLPILLLSNTIDNKSKNLENEVLMKKRTIEKSNDFQANNKINQKSQNFGKSLFNGYFKDNIFNSNYNPNYLINIGDVIELKLWGAFDLEIQLVVDIQGNVYIPKVGAIKLLGVYLTDVQKIIESKIKNVYKDNVFVYTNLNTFQPINILVTGNVENPGLYKGMSSDTILQFLDKSGGINNSGSYRNIVLIRNNIEIETFDLYEFLMNGNIKQPQLKAGDTILVKNIEKSIKVQGIVEREFLFELKNNKINLLEFLSKYTNIKNEATAIKINRKNRNNISNFEIKKIIDISNVDYLTNGDVVEVISEHYSDSINIRIIGELNNENSLVVKKGTTLQEILDKIKTNKFSDIDNIQLFKKSIAKNQKELMEKNLKELETLVLTNSANSSDEAKIMNLEKNSIIEFIKNARNIEFKGQLVINDKSEFSKILLEDGDIINIPTKNDIINVQGEIYFPNAYSYIENNKISDYIELSGGTTERANKTRILIIKKNGLAKQINLDTYIFSEDIIVEKGSSILVLPKVDVKNVQLTKDISQIFYNIAVGAGVLLSL